MRTTTIGSHDTFCDTPIMGVSQTSPSAAKRAIFDLFFLKFASLMTSRMKSLYLVLNSRNTAHMRCVCCTLMEPLL
jgi:hypothetical protein